MKRILATACIDPAAVFETAFAVAERLDAHVVGLGGVWPRQVFFSWAESNGSVAVEGALLLEREEEERTRAARKSFLAIASDRGVTLKRASRGQNGFSAEWRFVSVPGEGSVGSFGRAFDLIVVERPNDTGSFAQARLDGAILDSGRPVLMVPSIPSGPIGARVMIVWGGSIACSRSVALALPLLSKAEHIQIVLVRSAASASCEELEHSLSAQAGSVSVRTLVGRKEPDGNDLMSEAAFFDADLIVAGAYCGGPVRELITGGLTKSLIRAARVPVLFAH